MGKKFPHFIRKVIITMLIKVRNIRTKKAIECNESVETRDVRVLLDNMTLLDFILPLTITVI